MSNSGAMPGRGLAQVAHRDRHEFQGRTRALLQIVGGISHQPGDLRANGPAPEQRYTHRIRHAHSLPRTDNRLPHARFTS